MKQIGTALWLLAEALLVTSAYVLYYFSVRRMGMARHLIYLNGIWEKSLPVTELKIGAVALVSGLALWILVRSRNDQDKKARDFRLFVLPGALLSALFTGFALGFDARGLRAYYPLLLLFFLAVILWQTMTLLRLRRDPASSADGRKNR